MSGEIPSTEPPSSTAAIWSAASTKKRCDVVIVGSGAGGSCDVAALLAEAGRKVIVLEEGPYYRAAEYQGWKPSDAPVRRLFRESGMLTALGLGQTPMISVTLGRAVGGSSLLTGGVCFRIPGQVHHRWVRELGLDELSERALEAAYEDVERRLRVREVPSTLRSESTNRFVEGAARLGIAMHPLRRNTGDACEGNGRCNFGCPAGAKRSVDVAYLPAAIAHGARVVSDALVERVLVEHGRAAGVEGRILGGEAGAPSHRFRVTAPVVIAACGTLHTPLLLLASGLRDRAAVLGQNVTLHPGVRVVARFDQPVNGWDGAMQSVYSDHFAAEGIKLVGVYSAPNVLAAGLPGVGPALRRRVRQLPFCGVFGAMIHDEGGGTVRPGPGREPLLTYRMAPRDLDRLRRSITILSELAIAAGARDGVFHLGVRLPWPITSMDRGQLAHGARLVRRAADRVHGLSPARERARRQRPEARRRRSGRRELRAAGALRGRRLDPAHQHPGVNSQVPIMSIATRIAWRLAERFPRLLARARAAGDVAGRALARRREAWLRMKPTVFLFDIDGTLMDSGGAGRRSIERAFAASSTGGRTRARESPSVG